MPRSMQREVARGLALAIAMNRGRVLGTSASAMSTRSICSGLAVVLLAAGACAVGDEPEHGLPPAPSLAGVDDDDEPLDTDDTDDTGEESSTEGEPSAEGGTSTSGDTTGEPGCIGDCVERCLDGLDEDGDGDVDCHDADCATHLACTCTLTPDEGFGQHVLCDDPVPWAAARDACEGSDMHLVSIESAAHDAWLVGHSQALDPISWWMGYSDLQVEGAWAWVDGTPPGYQHWFPGEPNNGIDTPEHCAAFPEHDGESWNDLDCAVLRPFVCER